MEVQREINFERVPVPCRPEQLDLKPMISFALFQRNRHTANHSYRRNCGRKLWDVDAVNAASDDGK